MMEENCNSRGSRINKREIVLRTLEAQTVKGCRYPHSTLLYKAAGITGSGNEGKEGNKEGGNTTVESEEADVFNIHRSESQNR